MSEVVYCTCHLSVCECEKVSANIYIICLRCTTSAALKKIFLEPTKVINVKLRVAEVPVKQCQFILRYLDFICKDTAWEMK